MIEVNEPQVWTLIGVFGTALFGMLTLMSTMFVRILRTEIGSLRTEMRTEIGSLRSEMGTELRSVRGEIGSLRTEMQAEFASVRTEIKYLDRDVQALSRRVFGDDAA
ncbi:MULTISPECIES: hypothetical protein [unclassified Aeromicrobium]|uniref:hypothetical protein n=1 Tax=unclassified Aeromicrobium TaxID=2633570 RepID=UPI00190FD308|nr:MULTISPECIES: hypothetical protein [unclassified Aeromicrobium]